MNAVHFHLLVNHLPIFSSLFGIAILIWGLFRDVKSIRNIAYILLIVGAIASYVALESGENAEETIEEYLIDLPRTAIHDHEVAAEIALLFAIVTGLLSIISLAAGKLNVRFQHTLNGVLVLMAVFSLAVLIYTAYLGGKIRHPEEYQNPLQNIESTINTNIVNLQQ